MTALLQDTFSNIPAREADVLPAAQSLAADAAAISCHAIEDLAAFDALQDDWNALADRAGASQQLFQSFAWNRAWFDHYIEHKDAGCSCRLAIVTVRRGDCLELVWPLVIQRFLGLRQIIWMGYPVSQYGDILIAPAADAPALMRQSWRFIEEHFKPDLVSLRKVRADAAVAPYLSEMGARTTSTQGAPSLDLASAKSFADYELRYSGKSRKNRRRLLRRLSETGKVSFVHLGPGDEARRLAVRAIEMKCAWLDQRDMFSSAVREHHFRDFFADFAEAPRPSAPECRVSAILLDGEPLAVMIGLSYKRRFAGHVFAYDIAHEKSGAGVLLLEDLIRNCYERGETCLDLMSPADTYKLDWADNATETLDWAAPLSLAALAYCRIYLQGLKEPLKRAFEALPPRLRNLLRRRLLERSCNRPGAAPHCHAGPHAGHDHGACRSARTIA